MSIVANQKQPTDTELVAMSLKDPESFYHIMERYESKLLRYIQRFGNTGLESAEDILQEAFIKMYRHLHDFDTSLSFSTWAYRIVHNETVDYFRKKNRHTTISLDNAINNEEDDGVSLLNILRSETDLVDQATIQERKEKVREILQKLPSKYREVMILHYMEDKDYAEISGIIQKPAGTVATLLHRAKKQFKHYAQSFHLY